MPFFPGKSHSENTHYPEVPFAKTKKQNKDLRHSVQDTPQIDRYPAAKKSTQASDSEPLPLKRQRLGINAKITSPEIMPLRSFRDSSDGL